MVNFSLNSVDGNNQSKAKSGRILRSEESYKNEIGYYSPITMKDENFGNKK